MYKHTKSYVMNVQYTVFYYTLHLFFDIRTVKKIYRITDNKGFWLRCCWSLITDFMQETKVELVNYLTNNI